MAALVNSGAVTVAAPNSEKNVVSSRRTSLFELHQAAGAKIVPFAGWEMPVEYAGIRAEHAAVRTGAGIFDVSHMGEIETTGPGARDFLQHLLSNDLDKLAIGGAQYSVLCQEDGGIIDDLFTYKLELDRYLTVTNASNHLVDFEWFITQAGGFDVEVTDRANSYAMIALQGPQARGLLAALVEGEVPDRMRTANSLVAGCPTLICGTGYTGEPGVELLMDPAAAPVIWQALLDAGATPIGLGARDTLRLEVCFHLYGNDLSIERNAVEAGLAWCCAVDTGFIGSDVVAQAFASGTPEQLIPFIFTGPGIPRSDNPVLQDGVRIGTVTSGSLSPSLDRGIGMAYIRSDLAVPGTAVEVDVRGRLRPALLAERPLFKPTSAN